MGIVDAIFKSPHQLRVDNPITLKKDDCLLLNTKRQQYYVHTYDPEPILKRLEDDFKISKEVLSRFDNTKRDKCCNAIAITLYFKDCEHKTISRYLSGIARTAINVNKKLKDWIVRVYFDMSVYECIEKIQMEIQSGSNPDKKKISDEIIGYFTSLMRSPNVEMYTFKCDSILEIEKTRTYRYLSLIDPEVNISAIREADGYLNNVECHNLKMFAKSDRLFYIPPIIAPQLISVVSNPMTMFYNSYSNWLKLYKYIFENKFFSTHQNIYDLLAGLFTVKLKIKPAFYYEKINSLHKKIEEFKQLTLEGKKTKYPNSDIKSSDIEGIDRKSMSFFTSLHSLFEIKHTNDSELKYLYRSLDVGFDEILLLDIFKELISISFNTSNLPGKEPAILNDRINPYPIDKLKSLFYAYNIKQIDTTVLTTFKQLSDKLKELKIINPTFVLPEKYNTYTVNNILTGDNYALADYIILDDIIIEEPFMLVLGNLMNILRTLNTPYDSHKNIFDKEGIKNKYLKYKAKYLKLKMSLN